MSPLDLLFLVITHQSVAFIFVIINTRPIKCSRVSNNHKRSKCNRLMGNHYKLIKDLKAFDTVDVIGWVIITKIKDLYLCIIIDR
jgi:hypothetical protein